MNGSERILSRIRTDCDESVRKIETHAQHEHDRIIADAQHRADTQAAAVAEKTAQKRAQLETSSQSRAQLARRNALLKQRRKEIDTTVEELEAYLLGLGDNEYFEALYRLAAKLRGKSGEIFLSKKDLKRLPENFTKRMAAAGVDASVSQTPADITGGFILKCGDVEENMEFAAIISAGRDEIEDLINRELFAR
ncbi:MAG: V-type ATP synthase subunit E [Ruminococcus sp.]|nr:V-type ATP synthase subunit E [Ruminococcus sp.]MBQ3988167.1 V-type ATP synthase subunit E [Ruminococcus sp.]